MKHNTADVRYVNILVFLPSIRSGSLKTFADITRTYCDVSVIRLLNLSSRYTLERTIFQAIILPENVVYTLLRLVKKPPINFLKPANNQKSYGQSLLEHSHHQSAKPLPSLIPSFNSVLPGMLPTRTNKARSFHGVFEHTSTEVPRQFIYGHFVYYCIPACRTVIHPTSVSANHYFHQFQLLLTL